MVPALVRGIAVAGLATAMVAATTDAAVAAPRHSPRHTTPHPSSHHNPKAKPKAGPKSKAKTKAAVHGLVVSANGSTLVVLARTAVFGGRTVHNKTETVHLATPATKRHHHDAVPQLEQGDEINAKGVLSGGEIVDGIVQSSTPQPAAVVFGTVSSVNGTLVTLDARDHADGHGDGANGDQQGGDQQGGDQQGGDQQGGDQQGGDQQGGDQNGGGTEQDAIHADRGQHRGESLVVDTSAATFSGAETSPGALTTGEYFVALGERGGQDFVAADVITYTAAPAFVVGQVVAADQSTNSLTVAPHDGDTEDGTTTGTPVDTTNALIVVNGAQAGTYPATGDHVLALGPDGSAATSQPGAPLAATLVFAFNGEDRSPAGD